MIPQLGMSSFQDVIQGKSNLPFKIMIMKIYLAGFSGLKEREVRWQKLSSNRLLSYYSIVINPFETFTLKLIRNGIAWAVNKYKIKL